MPRCDDPRSWLSISTLDHLVCGALVKPLIQRRVQLLYICLTGLAEETLEERAVSCSYLIIDRWAHQVELIFFDSFCWWGNSGWAHMGMCRKTARPIRTFPWFQLAGSCILPARMTVAPYSG
ncbi:hypothetical protein EBZ35_03175 [bacterium]|nr:hypothetical protein [bacterium]